MPSRCAILVVCSVQSYIIIRLSAKMSAVCETFRPKIAGVKLIAGKSFSAVISLAPHCITILQSYIYFVA
jgi:hypothetical protein